MKHLFTLGVLTLLLSFNNITVAQVSVSDTGTIVQIVESLVSEGVVISNINLNCPGGAFGTFADTTNTLSIDNGLLLTSGSIFDVPGPNDMPGTGTNNTAPGDTDLDGLVPGLMTFDACFVEFDVTPSSDTLTFNYVFASEEYLEFVNAGVNDVFGFFISGPGITGKQNIAIVPGTANTPVSIDNVNDVTNSAFYVDNGDGSTPAANPNLEYDGHTTVLQAKTPVIPCQTYTLKLAVSDVGDGILDSGVFIEKGSLGSFGATIFPSSAYARFEYGVEGCNNGKFIFVRTIEPSFAVPLRWDLSGTAQNGIDYTDINGNPLGTIDTIQPFQDSLEVIIVPILDAVNDPLETIVLTLFDPCDDTTSIPTGDSVTLLLREEFIYDAGSDDSVCVGEFVELNSNFVESDSVFWSPPTGLNCVNCPNPMASPPTSTAYTVLVQDSVTKCLALDTVFVNVFNFPEPNPFSLSDSAFSVCDGAAILVDLNTVPDSTFSKLTYRWDSTTAFVLRPDSSRSVLQSILDRYFPFEITNENNCTTRDSVLIKSFPSTPIVMPEDIAICFGSDTFITPELALSPDLSYSYQWEPVNNRAAEEDISNPLAPNSNISPQESGSASYLLTVTNGICDDSEVLEVDVEDEIEVAFDYDSLGEFPLAPTSVSFTNETRSLFNFDFVWEVYEADNQTLVDTSTSRDFTYEFINPGEYEIRLRATDKRIGCEAFVLTFEKINEVIRPNVITPNGDGINDQFEIVSPPSEVWAFKVFNRWGKPVYSNDNYDNSWAAEDLPAGDYFYEIKNANNDSRYKGWLNVLK